VHHKQLETVNNSVTGRNSDCMRYIQRLNSIKYLERLQLSAEWTSPSAVAAVASIYRTGNLGHCDSHSAADLYAPSL